MTRPTKATVDYFPHYVHNGKTVFILEQAWGNDGYAFLFKVFELLGSSENHFIDCNNPADWLFLLSKTKLNEVIATDILDNLAELETIDRELWKIKVIWSESFVSNLQALYSRRCINVYNKPDIVSYCIQKHKLKGVSANINPQSKVKYSKVEKSKEYTSLGECQYVKLTKDELDKLIKKFGKELTWQKILNLENGIGSKGYKYKSHYHTILSWDEKEKREHPELQQQKDNADKSKEDAEKYDIEIKKESDMRFQEKLADMTPEQREKVERDGEDLRTGKTTIGELLGNFGGKK